MLLSTQSKQKLLEHLFTVIWLLASLGFITNVPKSVLTPLRQINFLGFTVNTSTMTISLPAVKKAEIQRETQLLRCPSIQTRTLACLLVKLVPMKPAVFIAPLHYHTLQSLKISALHAQQETVALSPEATNNLKWWSTQLYLHCSSPILKPVYCSWKPNPGARTVDAFSISCMGQGSTLLISSIFPDWQSFVKDQQRGSRFCMPGIVTAWPSQIWCSQLLAC